MTRQIQEKIESSAIGIVQILERQNKRLCVGNLAEELDHSRQELQAIVGGINLAVGLHLEFVTRRGHQSRNINDGRPQLVGITLPYVAADGFDERLIWHSECGVFVTVAHQSQATMAGDCPRELLAQGGLADARVTDQHHHAALACSSSLEQRSESLQFLIASYERASPKPGLVQSCLGHGLGT